jgi:surfeit locus 1 family protein
VDSGRGVGREGCRGYARARMFRFLLKPRWIVLGLFAVLMTALCVRLGFWQLDRLQGRRYYNHLFTQGMVMTPEPVEQLVDTSSGSGFTLLYRQAVATGTYDTAHEVILYGRSHEEQPGNHLLTPLKLPDGRAVIVDRGWVPFDMDTPPVQAAATPAGTVTDTGLLAPSEPGGSPQAGTTTTFTRVDLAQIGKQLPYPLLPYYLQLQQQTPAQSGPLPIPPPAPTLDEGPHRGYAIQWFSFATIAGLGFLLLVARELRSFRYDATPADGPPGPAEGDAAQGLGSSS